MIPYFDIIQGTEEWHRIRWGKIGGTSCKGLFIKTDTLLDEILSQHLEEFELDEDPFSNNAMDRGNEQEPYAREQLELYTGLKFIECGWLQSEENKLLGMSPDGITKDLKVQIEIKCPGRKKHTTTIRENVLPLDHIHQCVHAFTVNPLLERLIFGSFRYESIKPLFVKEINPESLVNLGTKAKPVIKKVSEWVTIAKSEEKALEIKLKAEIDNIIGV